MVDDIEAQGEVEVFSFANKAEGMQLILSGLSSTGIWFVDRPPESIPLDRVGWTTAERSRDSEDS